MACFEGHHYRLSNLPSGPADRIGEGRIARYCRPQMEEVMNGANSRDVLARCGATRFVANVAFVAAVAGIILTRGVIPASAANDKPAAGTGSRQVVIDCKETDKKVKLAPNEGSVTFVFQNCSCWRRNDFPKQYVKQIVDHTIANANSGKRTPTIITASLLPIRSETLTVPIGETKTAEFYCYPKARLDKLDAWSDSLVKPGNQ
jgi:hypothetical protein